MFDILMDEKRLEILLNGDQNRQISMLIMHFHSLVVLDSDLGVMGVFKNMVKHPEQYIEAYLPGIPHDDDFEVFNQFGKIKGNEVKFYQCPDGHIYTIGDCTRPATTSVSKIT